jgi:L-lactate dehydrogenase
VHAFIIGEHGDSEIPVWSTANVAGVPINKFCEMRGHYEHAAAMKKIADEVKNSAYEIISRKKATYYGVAMAVKRICEAIIRDEKSVLPVSNMMHGAYGINNITLSIPAIVGKNGVELQMPISLDGNEALALKASADLLKKIAADAGVGDLTPSK